MLGREGEDQDWGITVYSKRTESEELYMKYKQTTTLSVREIASVYSQGVITTR